MCQQAWLSDLNTTAPGHSTQLKRPGSSVVCWGLMYQCLCFPAPSALRVMTRCSWTVLVLLNFGEMLTVSVDASRSLCQHVRLMSMLIGSYFLSFPDRLRNFCPSYPNGNWFSSTFCPTLEECPPIVLPFLVIHFLFVLLVLVLSIQELISVPFIFSFSPLRTYLLSATGVRPVKGIIAVPPGSLRARLSGSIGNRFLSDHEVVVRPRSHSSSRFSFFRYFYTSVCGLIVRSRTCICLRSLNLST